MVRESIAKLLIANWPSELCVEHRDGGSGEPQPWEAAGVTAGAQGNRISNLT